MSISSVHGSNMKTTDKRIHYNNWIIHYNLKIIINKHCSSFPTILKFRCFLKRPRGSKYCKKQHVFVVNFSKTSHNNYYSHDVHICRWPCSLPMCRVPYTCYWNVIAPLFLLGGLWGHTIFFMNRDFIISHDTWNTPLIWHDTRFSCFNLDEAEHFHPGGFMKSLKT